MNITNNDFFAAINNAYLWSFVISATGQTSSENEPSQQPRLRLHYALPASGSATHQRGFVDIECSLEVVNCTTDQGHGATPREITQINFFVFMVLGGQLARNFFQKITPDSDVRFRIVAFKSIGAGKSRDWVTHRLYGNIDGELTLLKTYTGPQDHSSPVQCRTLATAHA